MNHGFWHFLQTTDSAFPVGGFAHSYGLEGMVQAGAVRTPGDLNEFLLKTWIPILTHIDFPLVRLSHRHASELETVFRLDQLAWAVRATSESRRAQQQMGQQRLKLIARLTGHPRLSELSDMAASGGWMANWPVVCGVECACLGSSLEESLTAYAYQSINGILAASAKLIRIGPTEIQQMLHACGHHVEKARTTSVDIHEDEIGWFSPLLDITGAGHEHAYSRLFIS